MSEKLILIDTPQVMPDNPIQIKTPWALWMKIYEVENWVEDNYGFRPNVFDDITGLSKKSFSEINDPQLFEQQNFWPEGKTDVTDSSQSPTKLLPINGAEPDGESSQWPTKLLTINGAEPDGEVSRYTNGIKYLLNVEYEGNQYKIETGNRASHTRSGVHMHESGGVTWILDGGDMTIYVEDLDPTTFEEETRFYMPSNVPMSAANLSEQDSVQMNIFLAPIGQKLATVLDPNF